MAGELHEISQAIGRVEAVGQDLQRQSATLFRKVEEMQR
jgi:hypothetical protein